VKQDIDLVTSHKMRQCDKFSFSTMSLIVSDDSFVMSVTICEVSMIASVIVDHDPFEMFVAKIFVAVCDASFSELILQHSF
jgi:hypothetical protein